jgi:hypothetical protein
LTFGPQLEGEGIDFGDEIGEKSERIRDLSGGLKKKCNRLDGFPIDLGVLFVDHKKKKDGQMSIQIK